MKPLLFALVLVSGCARGTWVVLDLDGTLAPSRVEVALTLDSAMSSHSLGSLTLPTNVAIQLPHGGQFSAALSAFDDAGVLIGQGVTSGLVGTGGTATLHVQLGPNATGGDGGSGGGALSATPTHVDFGTVIAGIGSQPVTIEVTNSGTARLGALQVIRTQNDFVLVSDSCVDNLLSPGATCRVVVRYAPQATGMAQGMVGVSAPTGESVEIALAGTSVAQGTLQIMPATRDFGVVGVGSASDELSFTVTNNGAATLPLTSAITGADATSFLITGDGCSGVMLAASQGCTVELRFSPTARGSRSATLALGDGADAQGLASLGGTGQAPGALKLTTPGGLDFGSVILGAHSTTLTVLAANSGDLPVGPLAVALPSGAITLDSDLCSGQTLVAGGQCQLSLSFSPSAIGVVSAQLSLSATGVSPAQVTLSGAGVAAGMPTVSPTSWDFGGVPSVPPAVKTFTVNNSGGQPTAPLSVVLDGDTQWSLANDHCSGVSLAAATSCTVDVSFAPSSFGAKTTTLHLAGSDVPLSGSMVQDVVVAITVNGNGSGSVGSSAAGSIGGGLDCGSRCNAHYTVTAADQSVTFTANPNTGSVVSGWSVAGCGTAVTCTVPVTQATAMTLSLGLQQLGLDVSVTSTAGATGNVSVGSSVVTSSMHFNLDYGSLVTLTANPTAPGYFGGWSGICASFQPTCTFHIFSTQAVGAAFSPANKIFITSTTYSAGTVGSLSNADALCHARALAGSLSGNFVAVLSTSTVNARDRLSGARGWVRPDGLPVRDAAPVANGLPEAFYPVRLDEHGADAGATAAWTGSDLNGAFATGNTCADWTSNDSLTIGGEGSTTTAYGWLSAAGNTCSSPARLYCAQVDYQAVVQPAPQPSRIAFIADFGVNSQGRAWADTSCQSDASAAHLPGTYHAFLAGVGSSAGSRFDRNGLPWRRVDGPLLAATAGDFLDGKWLTSLDYTAAGTWAGWGIWLGAPDPKTAGTDATTCNDWSADTNSATGFFLIENQTNFQGASAGCSLTFSPYCLQD